MRYSNHIIWNGYTLCPHDWKLEKTKENFFRVYYILDGEAYCKIDNKNLRLEPKTLYIFPIQYEYSLWQNIDNPLRVLWFHVDTGIMCTRLIKYKIERESIFDHLIKAMIEIANKNENFDELQEIFDAFIILLQKKLGISCYPQNQINEMKYIISYIDDNIGKQIDVNHLAANFDMERSYFSRRFKEWFYISPNQYIKQRKMNYAVKSLMVNESIKEAATLAGYCDEKSFSKAFKSYMGVTPGNFRKRKKVQP